MYGLPKEFDGLFLIGRIVEMVCFYQYQVSLNFGDKTIIAIGSAFSYNSTQVINVPVQQSNLMGLLGASVSKVQCEDNGTLCLQFNDGQTLKVYDTSKHYESYSIRHEGKEIIV
jgi:hypothetical protein